MGIWGPTTARRGGEAAKVDGNVSWELLLAIRNGNDFIDVAGELGVDKYKIIYKSIQGSLYSGNYHLTND